MRRLLVLACALPAVVLVVPVFSVAGEPLLERRDELEAAMILRLTISWESCRRSGSPSRLLGFS
jgi:hypothetical protein